MTDRLNDVKRLLRERDTPAAIYLYSRRHRIATSNLNPSVQDFSTTWYKSTGLQYYMVQVLVQTYERLPPSRDAAWMELRYRHLI